MKKIFTIELEPNVWYINKDYYEYIPNVVKQVKRMHENSCGDEISLSTPYDSYLVFYLEDVESFINDIQKEYEIENKIQKKKEESEEFIDDIDKYDEYEETNIDYDDDEYGIEDEETNIDYEYEDGETVIQKHKKIIEDDEESSFDFSKLANKTVNKYDEKEEEKMDIGEDELITMEEQIILDVLNNKYYKNIVSFLSIIFFKNLYEIYNVCTVKTSRGKGIAKKIISTIIKEFVDNDIWLSVSLTNTENRTKINPFFNKLVNMYTSLGFIPKEIVFSSPSGFFWNYPNLSMILPKDRTFLGEDAYKNKEKAIKIADSFIKTKGICNLKYAIDPKTINEIYEFITEDEEYSGIFEGNKKMGGYFLNISRLIKGTSEGEIFNVLNPPTFVNWHTHPFICYVRGNCFIQWPSGVDLSYVFINYIKGNVLHFVFSEEGVYGINLKKEIMFLLRFMTTKCIYYFSELISFYFTNFEKYRSIEYDKEREKCFEENYDDFNCYTYNNETRHKSIDSILREMNNLTFKKLLKNEDNDPKGITDIKKEIKNTGCLNKAINLYNSTGLFGPFGNPSIFKINFKYQEKAKKNGIIDKIEYYLPPGEVYCK